MTAAANTCHVATCDRPVQDANVCAHCHHALRRDLAQVPALVGELVTTLTRNTRRIADRRPGGAERALIVNLAASRAADNLTAALTRAATTASTVTGTEGWRAEFAALRPAAIAGWLTAASEALRHADQAGPVIDGVNAAIRAAWRIVDLPANRTTFPVGPCPEQPDGTYCPGEIRAYIPADRTTTASLACPACDTTWWPWQWTRAGHRILARRAQLVA